MMSWRMRKRYALLIGMILCLGLTGLSSFFVWEITVSGNEKVSAAEILSNLEDLGVHIGCSRLTINQDYLSNEMLQRVPELCWITVNTHGSRADVKVREEIPAPEVIDEKEATVVFAKKSGIIEKMVVLEGAKNVAVGETVQAGDILVTGEMESLSSGTRYVHAMGDIYARTWYTRSVQLSETVGIKNYTGNEKTRYTLVLGGHRISLSFRDLGWEHYDKEIHEKKLKLLGAVLPVGVAAETYEEYTVEYVPASNLEETLKARLLDDLKEETDGGEIIWTEFETKSEEGVMTVTVNAECLEQIGEVRKLTEKDLHESEETG